MRNAPAQEQHDIACAQRGLDHAWQVLQQNRPSVSAFPMFVPSLSWQRLRFEHFKGGNKRRFHSTMERRRLEGSGKCERCDPGITTKPPSLGPTSWNCARVNSMARGGSLLIATCNLR